MYLNGERVAMKLHGSQAGWYFFVNDHLGTPQKIINESGQVVWAGFYLPFGKAWAYPATITNNFRFPGQYYDAETGLHYNWHRYYDPDTGRYITADPIGLEGGVNLYAYVMGNPLNFSDPRGLDPIDPDTGKRSEVMGCHHTHKVTEEEIAILMMLFDIADIPSGEGIIPGIGMVLGKKGAKKVGSTRHIHLKKADNGAYMIQLDDGTAYIGKGGTNRARKSARRVSKQQNSPVDDIAHWPEPDDASAFAKEAELIESVGGKDAPDILNKINSPGKK